ncbi:MAG TPA: phosphotransferase [Candidatus Paceibacterota bacterium]|jgi:Putative homoserine kinase type II (protein kinase fold)
MEELTNALSKHFDIGNKISISKIDAGFLSENYLVESRDKKFFLKGYVKGIERVHDIHKVKSYFASHGIPVILPLETRSGETLFVFGSKVFALFPFATGIHHNRQSIPDKVTVEIAALLARMHHIATDFPMTISATFKYWDRKKLDLANELIVKIDSIPEKTEFDIRAKRNIELKKTVILKEDIPIDTYKLEQPILLHGDFHELNIFFDELDRIKYVFDFGETKMGPRGFELWRSTDYMFFDGKFTDENIRKAVLYLKTYNSLNPISKEELSNAFQVYYLMNIHSFWVESEHYLKENTRVDRFLEVRSTSYFVEHKEELLQRILDEVYK